MNIFIEIGVILFIATVISITMRILRQPLVVGYIVTGVVVGPYLLNFTESRDHIEIFSKFGIAILLFIVGLSLKPDVRHEIGKVALVTGLGQVIFTSLIGFFIMRALEFSITASIYGAIALTFSSTIIIMKLLSDRGDLDKLYGKISIGFLLVQDIVATIILLFVSIWGGLAESSISPEIFIFEILIKMFAVFFVLYILGKYLIPSFSKFLSSSQELLFLFSITWGLGISALFYKMGFSLEIGALAAGVALSVSPYSQEISSRMKPLRDFFILLFFVMLGSQIILADVAGMLTSAVILSLFVLIGNPIIVFVLMNLLGYKSKTGFMAGLTVAQISEFSLILMALGLSFGHLEQSVVSLITLVGIITIAGSTYFILYADQIYKKVKRVLSILEFKKAHSMKDGVNKEKYDAIIFGYDRVGYDFIHAMDKLEDKYLVVDFNPESIEKLVTHNIPHLFGDADDIDFLKEIDMANACAVISTIPDFKTNMNLVSYYRNHNKKGIIVVISQNIKDAKELYETGASFVIMPHYLGAKFASELISKNGLNQKNFEEERVKHLKYLEHRHKLTN